MTSILTIPELCQRLRVHQSTVYRMLKAHSIPGAFKIGRDWRFNSPDVEKWVRGLETIREKVA